MKNYQTLIGLALVAAAIVAAALILRNGNGKFQRIPVGTNGNLWIVFDTATGNSKLVDVNE